MIGCLNEQNSLVVKLFIFFCPKKKTTGRTIVNDKGIFKAESTKLFPQAIWAKWHYPWAQDKKSIDKTLKLFLMNFLSMRLTLHEAFC